jgi:hypothetical protein
MIRSTATPMFADIDSAIAQIEMAEGDRNHAFRLAHRACQRQVDELANPSPCADLVVPCQVFAIVGRGGGI